MNNYKIAVDGPAGSGKSTIAKLIAEKLNILYIDSGAMYRAVTYKCLSENIDMDSSDEICRVCYSSEITLEKREKKIKVYVDSEDVTESIRTREVTNNVFKIAREPKVRERLVYLQRKYGENNSVIMDGRDIGTVVFKDAEIKIYLDASAEERTNRRKLELEGKGENVNFTELYKEVVERDNADKNRKVGPLKIADDAIVIDTTGMDISEVTEKCVKLIEERINEN